MSSTWTALKTLDGVTYWQDKHGRLSLDSPEIMAEDSGRYGQWLWLEGEPLAD